MTRTIRQTAVLEFVEGIRLKAYNDLIKQFEHYYPELSNEQREDIAEEMFGYPGPPTEQNILDIVSRK